MSEAFVTVIMPALNEEENIEAAIEDTLNAFDFFELEGELYVIDDGSTDRTEALVRRAMERDPRLRLLSHETPHGIGASFWGGLDRANGEYVVMLPGDNENDPFEIFRYHRLLSSVDMVIPFVFNKQVRSLFRNALSQLFRFIINTTFLVYFNYTNGTVIYRRSLLRELEHRSEGFFFQTDILIRLVKRGYLFAEVPYRLGMRSTGASKALSFPTLFDVAKGYFQLVKDVYRYKYDDVGFDRESATFKRHSDKSPSVRHGPGNNGPK